MKKVTIDYKKCINCKSCVYACPEGFEIDENNKPVVKNSNAECVEDAAEICPVSCIEITDES